LIYRPKKGRNVSFDVSRGGVQESSNGLFGSGEGEGEGIPSALKSSNLGTGEYLVYSECLQTRSASFEMRTPLFEKWNAPETAHPGGQTTLRNFGRHGRLGSSLGGETAAHQVQEGRRSLQSREEVGKPIAPMLGGGALGDCHQKRTWPSKRLPPQPRETSKNRAI
jgi:hypothetical protein